MALSLARPDPSSPSDVSTATFTTSRKGFDADEVREFLRLVAAELTQLQARAAELQAVKQAPTVSLAELDDETVTGLLGEEATRIVTTARETATQIKVRAEEASARLVQEANEEAQRVRADAEIEAGRRRQDATSAAADELQMAKQQGRDMVNEARAYRERVLGELSRRREVARKQIEQLIHNRDRLMQSFERSRLIAMEVVAELAPQGATSDLVDLAPITGPVPLVVPAREVEKPKPEPMPTPEVAVPEVAAPERVVPEVAVPERVVPEREAAVDDLFARIRAVTTKPTPEKEVPKPKAAKKSRAAVEPKQQELSVFQASPPEPEQVVGTTDSPFGRRDAALAPLVATAARNLKRVLADEQNDVLQLLRGREPIRLLTIVLPESAVHIQRYSDAIADELLAAALAGAAAIDDGDTEQQRAAIKREAALIPAIESLAASIVSPLRDRIERVIEVADGANTELVNLTRTVYREWKTRRIDDHIDDVMRMAFGRGALAVLRAGTPICWVVDPNGPSCPDAEDNALAGAVGAGEPFPTEHVWAPAHEGCRCLLQLAAR